MVDLVGVLGPDQGSKQRAAACLWLFYALVLVVRTHRAREVVPGRPMFEGVSLI